MSAGLATGQRERSSLQTLVSGFPELKGATFTLADWFDDPNVAQELQAMQRARNLGLTQIASAASDAIGCVARKEGRLWPVRPSQPRHPCFTLSTMAPVASLAG